MKSDNDTLKALQVWTEAFLTKRKKRKLKQKMRQQAKHPVLDWTEAILWAACVVLLINQYLFQAYRIPSESMLETLQVGDMIFVNKLVYGPELLPGVVKLGGPWRPSRGEVVIFENPSYLSRGPAFTIFQQMLYMLTFTAVDIDRDEQGAQKVHYLIKRAVGMPGDRLRVARGEVYYRFEGTDSWIAERDYLAGMGEPDRVVRMVDAGSYPAIEAAGEAGGWTEAGLGLPERLERALKGGGELYRDPLASDAARVRAIREMYPHEASFAQGARRDELGWYIPEGRVFPMGDNRDNSRDARYFGPVSIDKVLGKALFIYWPLGRAGGIR